TPDGVILADHIRVGGRNEQVVNGIVTFPNLVTTNSADNPTSFGYIVTITVSPKGAQQRIVLTTSAFPLTASANLKDIDEAWDEWTAPPSWRSAFTDQMDAKLLAASASAESAAAAAALAEAISGADTADELITILFGDPTSDVRVQHDARVTTQITTTQPRTPLLGRKVKGGNIVPKPGAGWGQLWAEWDWTNWIKPQVDRAVALGLNTVRLIGGPRAVFMSPTGFSQITQAQYDARWAQLATYCLTRGLALYPALCEKWDFYDLAPGSENYQHAGLTASIKTTAASLSRFPNVIGFDVFQEGDARTGSAWAQSTAYGSIGQHVNNSGRSYKVVTPGTSAASGTGPSGTGASITDGTVVWAYDGIPVLVADVLALMAAIRTVSSVPVTMSFPPYGNNIPWYNTDYMWALVYADAAGADFIDVHLYSSAVVPSDLDYLTQKTGKPVLIGEYGIAQDATMPNQADRMTTVAAVHNRPGVLGSLVWGLADQSTTDAGKFGVWDNTGFIQGAAPLSTTSGKRATLTDPLPTFKISDPAPAIRTPNMLDPIHAKSKNNITDTWSASANTNLVSDPRGLGFKSTASGDMTLTIRATDRVFYTVSANTWYRFKATLLADTTGRNVEASINWTDAAGTTLSSSLAATGTDSVRTPLTLDLVAKSHASAVRAQLIVKVIGTGAANELHVLMDAELTAV
ncbi:MAG: hypothetical protein ABWY20_23010, partial [Mycobacterium sp.]